MILVLRAVVVEQWLTGSVERWDKVRVEVAGRMSEEVVVVLL